VAQNSGFHDFNICTLCREASSREPFAKIPFASHVLDIASCSDNPRFIILREDQNKNRLKTESFVVFESSIFVNTER